MLKETVIIVVSVKTKFRSTSVRVYDVKIFNAFIGRVNERSFMKTLRNSAGGGVVFNGLMRTLSCEYSGIHVNAL